MKALFVVLWLPLVLLAASELPFDSLALSLSKGALAQGRQTTSSSYVGAQACASCHTQVHDTWTAGRHSKMLQPATPATVKGNFAQTSATLHGLRYGFRTANGQYFITESELTGKPVEHRVEFTLGSRRIQHYVTTIDKGRMVVLAPSWDVQRSTWFHNVEIIRPDEDDRQVVQQWNKSCVGCHVSRQENGYDPATRAYKTEWTDFGTSCERCHGPGKAHVDAKTAATIVRPTRLDANASTAVCAQCHSLRTAINPDYKAGDDYYDFFVPALEYGPYARPDVSLDPPYWADGRPRRFSNDAMGLWESQCFLKGGATCTTCHTNPHLPDIDKNPQLGQTLVLSPSQDEPGAPGSTGSPRAGLVSNALCTKCHQPIAARLTAHTRHKAGSAGSACVECHMPKTVVSIKATMRDHTIGVPAPENSVRFNIPNACTECHSDKPAQWAVDALKTWSPQGRRTKLIAQAEAFSAARADRGDALDGLLAIAADEQRAPLIRANAIGYLGHYNDPRAIAAIVSGAASPHPAIRAIAIAALREAGRSDPSARRAALASLTDPKRSVRIAALITLVEQGGTDLSAGDLARFRYVANELTAWTRVNQQDPDLQRIQGIVHLLTGDPERAAGALGISIDLEPNAPTVKFFLALARLGQRRVDEARTLLSQVPHTDPFYARAQEQLRRLPQ